MSDGMKVLLQYLLPKQGLTTFAGRIARTRGGLMTPGWMQDDPRGSEWRLGNWGLLRITLTPGFYMASRQAPDGQVGAATSTRMTGAEVRSPSDWRFWLLHTNAETGEAEKCSEVYMVGDVLVWANWLQMPKGVRRVRYSVSKREGGASR